MITNFFISNTNYSMKYLKHKILKSQTTSLKFNNIFIRQVLYVNKMWVVYNLKYIRGKIYPHVLGY